MKITYLKTIGFRKNEKEFETKLFDITNITGGNTKGKSNILYAIIWAFLGTNLTGDDKVWLGNKNTDNCYVELDFIDNQGDTHKIIRYKNRYDNKKNFIMLDNNPAEPEDLQKFYGDKKLFLSILNSNYFINKKPAEQKELLDKYLPNIDISSVYNNLSEEEKQNLEGCPKNILNYLKELNSNKKMYEDKIKIVLGQIEYAEKILDTDIEEKKEFKKVEELSLARQELSFLTSNKSSINKSTQEKIITELNNQIQKLQQQIEDLSIKMQTDKSQYLTIKNKPNSCCNLCGQTLPDENKSILIKNLKEQLEEIFLQKTKQEQELLNLKSKLTIEKCKLYSLENSSENEKAKQITTVQEQIHLLEQEQLEIEKFNNAISIKQNNINLAKQDIEKFKKQIQNFEHLIDNIKQAKNIAQKLYINYIEEKMKFATKHLKNVNIRYYSVLKESGELKDDFIITYKETEIKNLSRSENIAASLELSNMFNQISKINLPLFIDDSESCADYNFIEDYSKNTQILIAQVIKGEDLKIEDYYIKNNEYLQVA